MAKRQRRTGKNQSCNRKSVETERGNRVAEEGVEEEGYEGSSEVHLGSAGEQPPRKRTTTAGAKGTQRLAFIRENMEDDGASVEGESEEEGNIEDENMDNQGVPEGNDDVVAPKVPETVLAEGDHSAVSSHLTNSNTQGSVTGGSTIVSYSTSSLGTSGATSVAGAHKFGNVKAAVRKTVFRYIKFLGKANSRELDWDKKIASLIYSHLNMTNWSRANKKMWWEADDNSVARWVTEAIAARRSEVTQGIHRSFLGKCGYLDIVSGYLQRLTFIKRRHDRSLWKAFFYYRLLWKPGQ